MKGTFHSNIFSFFEMFQNSFEYGNVVFKTSVDVCKVFNGRVATFVVKAVLEHFEKTKDIGMECPFHEV